MLAKALNIPFEALVTGIIPSTQIKQINAEYNIRDSVLDDLDVLAPEDADVWRAKIRAAAIKVRRINEERDRDRADKQPADPPLEARRA